MTPAPRPASSTASCARWPAPSPHRPPAPPPPQKPHIPQEPQKPHTPLVSPRPQEPLAPQQPPPPLWDLAVAATTLRASLATSAPPGLLEAVAALQDLAVRQVPAAERDQRIAELGQIQRALLPAIVTAKNGPYLVTNVPAVRTPLGETLTLPPQLALCRCGASASQAVLRRDARRQRLHRRPRTPSRVPDQRDTYPGQQVTIFDNRGICQHSGLCTDRVADRVPHRRRAVRGAERRPDGRDRPGRARLPVRGAEPGLRRYRGARPGRLARLAGGRDRGDPGRPLPGDRRDRPRPTPLARTCPGPRARPGSTMRCAAAATRRTSRSAAACTWYVEFRDPARGARADPVRAGPVACPP